MPIYEYEPFERECLMCDGKVEALQAVNDEPLKLCPQCGLAVVRVISRASITTKVDISPDAAAKQGFATFKRAGKGTWEKLAGPDHITTGNIPQSELDD